MSSLYVTQAGALALQSAGLAGWTNLVADVGTVVPTPPDRLAVLADFTVAAYTGYTAPTVTLTGGYVDSHTGKVYCLSAGIHFDGPSSGAGVNPMTIVLSDSVSHAVFAWLDIADANAQLQLATDHLQVALQMFEDLTASIFVVS